MSIDSVLNAPMRKPTRRKKQMMPPTEDTMQALVSALFKETMVKAANNAVKDTMEQFTKQIDGVIGEVAKLGGMADTVASANKKLSTAGVNQMLSRLSDSSKQSVEMVNLHTTHNSLIIGEQLKQLKAAMNNIKFDAPEPVRQWRFEVERQEDGKYTITATAEG